MVWCLDIYGLITDLVSVQVKITKHEIVDYSTPEIRSNAMSTKPYGHASPIRDVIVPGSRGKEKPSLAKGH
jgi:hypothetical protein